MTWCMVHGGGGAWGHRVFRPDLVTIEVVGDGMMMTMDDREDRVRIVSDKDGKVVHAFVG